MRWKLLLVVLLLGGALAARLSLFTVDRTEFAYLTEFGRPVRTFDGAKDDEAGLHLKWPWPVQSVQRYDRRLQFFDLPGAELLTRDPKRNTIDKTLTVDAYVCWRIADEPGAVDRFVRSVGTPEGARAILGQRVNSELGAAVGRLELDDLISVEAGKVDATREALRRRLLDEGAQPLRASALRDYGIDVVDVRVRRISHPQAVQQEIFNRIRSEREKKVAEYRGEGELKAADIRSEGERKATLLKAQADAEALRQRGLADAAADTIRNDAARQDPQFYAFLKKLEEYQKILGDNKTMLLLSTHRGLFDALLDPPGPGGSPTLARPSQSAPAPPAKTGGD
jgi:membrane protease subunit HflC